MCDLDRFAGFTMQQARQRAPWLTTQLVLGCGTQPTSLVSVSALALRGIASESGEKTGKLSPITLRNFVLTLLAGAGVVATARYYEQEKLKSRMNKTQQVAGKAAVGGPFSLVDQDGKLFTQENLRGQFSVLYFGFTHCPDICPTELEKLAEALDIIEKEAGVKVLPVFISVDPERDTPEKVKAYVKEFHPRLLGLTGDLDSVKSASKAYRVYFHKANESDTDYLVDHSIITYLLNPDADFVTFYGKNFTAEQMAKSIIDHIKEWKGKNAT